MKTIKVPQRAEVSPVNQANFDNITASFGKVPNLYATFAYSEHALNTYLALQSSKSSLTAKQKEIINLVVSQVNDCRYCLSAHTVVGKMNGFTDEQILEIRSGNASFDPKLNVLAQLVKSIANNKGKVDPTKLENYFAAGYTYENLVDTIVAVGDKIISNYLHAVTQVPVDFPLASELTESVAHL